MSVTTMAGKNDAGAETPPPKDRKKKLLAVLGLVGIGAAAWFFLLRPPAEPAEPEPGEVMALEPVQVNLAGGHYLKIGLALQLTADAHEAEGSKAIDAAIELFSGRPMEELSRPEDRQKLREQLEEELEHRYHGEVMEVYFTDFVTQ